MQPLSGCFEGKEHILPLRVYYEDTDAIGIVYYANYLKFAERARTEMLRMVGIQQQAMSRDFGLAFAVRDCAVDYRSRRGPSSVCSARARSWPACAPSWPASERTDGLPAFRSRCVRRCVPIVSLRNRNSYGKRIG